MYIFVLLSLISVVSSLEIKELPGLKEKLNFKHFTGYLKASETHRLFYWYMTCIKFET